MALNRKDFIKTASIALVGLAGNDLNSEQLETYNSIKFELITLKGSVLDRFNFAKQAGFNALEVNSHGYNREEMLLASKITGLKIVSVYNSDNWIRSISSLSEDERSQALKSVEESVSTADFYNAEYVHVLPGLVDNEYPEKSKESLLKSLQEISVILKDFKVKVLLQNFPSMFFNEASFFKEILSSLNSENFGICLDVDSFESPNGLSVWSKILEVYPSKLDLQSYGSHCRKLNSKLFKNVNCISESKI